MTVRIWNYIFLWDRPTPTLHTQRLQNLRSIFQEK